MKPALSMFSGESIPRIARAVFCSLALCSIVLAGSALPARADEKPVVLELYTSQGCSSCPPADKLLGEIARKPNVIAISLPVDYWDYIGWKDTFAKPSHTARQRAYARSRGDGQVYTPQAVINGVVHVVGSDAAAIQAAAESAHGKSGAMTVPMKASEKDGVLNVEVGAAPGGVARRAILMLVRVTRSSTVAIGRGENNGRTVNYTNIGRAAARIGEWTGGEQSFRIAPDAATSPEADGWVLILQTGDMKDPGVILAAAKSPGL